MAEMPKPLIVVVLASDFERVHYALATAAAAAAIGRATSLFFTQGAVRAIAGTECAPGWWDLIVADPTLGGEDALALDRAFTNRGAAGFEEILLACKEIGIEFLVCSMGLRVANLTVHELRRELAVEEAGLVEILSRGDMLTVI